MQTKTETLNVKYTTKLVSRLSYEGFTLGGVAKKALPAKGFLF